MNNAKAAPEVFTKRGAETGDLLAFVYRISLDTSNGEIVVCDPGPFGLAEDVFDMSVDRLTRRRAMQTAMRTTDGALDIGCRVAGAARIDRVTVQAHRAYVIFGASLARTGAPATQQDDSKAAKQYAFDLCDKVKIFMKHAVDLKYRYAEEATPDVCSVSIRRCAVRVDGSSLVGVASRSDLSAVRERGNLVPLGEQNDRRQEGTKVHASLRRASSSISQARAVLRLKGCGQAGSCRVRGHHTTAPMEYGSPRARWRSG